MKGFDFSEPTKVRHSFVIVHWNAQVPPSISSGLAPIIRTANSPRLGEAGCPLKRRGRVRRLAARATEGHPRGFPRCPGARHEARDARAVRACAATRATGAAALRGRSTRAGLLGLSSRNRAPPTRTATSARRATQSASRPAARTICAARTHPGSGRQASATSNEKAMGQQGQHRPCAPPLYRKQTDEDLLRLMEADVAQNRPLDGSAPPVAQGAPSSRPASCTERPQGSYGPRQSSYGRAYSSVGRAADF